MWGLEVCVKYDFVVFDVIMFGFDVVKVGFFEDEIGCCVFFDDVGFVLLGIVG